VTSLPSLTGKAPLAALRKAGFELVRTRGSRHFLRHAEDLQDGSEINWKRPT